jgi:hypothetical protein
MFFIPHAGIAINYNEEGPTVMSELNTEPFSVKCETPEEAAVLKDTLFDLLAPRYALEGAWRTRTWGGRWGTIKPFDIDWVDAIRREMDRSRGRMYGRVWDPRFEGCAVYWLTVPQDDAPTYSLQEFLDMVLPNAE